MSKLPIIAGIYKITSPSGRIYIGQSWNIHQRFSGYKRKPPKRRSKILYSSFEKYGYNNHKFEIAYELPLDSTQEVMNNYECFFIEQFREGGFELMNIKEGGNNGKHSEETKKLISAAGMGRQLPKEALEKIRIANLGNKNCIGKQNSLGYKHTDEWKKKKSIQSKGNKSAIGNKNRLGKKHSESTKKILREKNIGKKLSDEHKKSIGESVKKNVTWNRPVIQMDMLGNEIARFNSAKEAAIALNITRGNISTVISGQRNHAGGFKWKYA